MKLSLYVLLIAITATCPVRAATQSGPTEPPTSHFQGQCDSDPDGTTFAAKACQTKFQPGRLFNKSKTGYGQSYTPPRCGGPATAHQKEVLAKVYTTAPDYMKAKLCRLTQLFIVPGIAPHASWGFWEQPPRTGTYIGISSRALDEPSSIQQHERRIWLQLVGLRKFLHPNALPRMTSDSTDTAHVALGVMAHELGHILLADTNADGVDEHHPRRQYSGPPRSACFEKAFIEASWNGDIFHKKMRRWVEFGAQNGNELQDSELAFKVNRLKQLGRRALDRFAAVIRKINQSGQFASTLAAVSPEEDFVETYKYKVWADALPSLVVADPGNDQQVALKDRLAQGTLKGKVDCLGDLGLLSGAP